MTEDGKDDVIALPDLTEEEAEPPPPPEDEPVATTGELETDDEATSSSSSDGEQKKKKLKRNRCPVCNKKLTVVNEYECRCGLSFCSTHRYAETHNCTFDYKEEGKRILTQANPVIVATKVNKI